MGFPDSSGSKESACNAGDPGSIPGSGSFPGEEIRYPLKYFSASLVTQMVKKLPAMRETWVQSLAWEDLLEKGMATHLTILAWRVPWTEEPGRSMGEKAMAPHSSNLAWRFPWTEEPGGPTVHGVAKSRTRLSAHAQLYFPTSFPLYGGVHVCLFLLCVSECL